MLSHYQVVLQPQVLHLRSTTWSPRIQDYQSLQALLILKFGLQSGVVPHRKNAVIHGCHDKEDPSHWNVLIFD